MTSPEPAAQPSLAATEQEGSPQPQPQPQQHVPEAAAAVPEAEAYKVEGAEVEEEEEGECGLILFMKAGGCRDTFVAWKECVEAAQKDGDDMDERCHKVTANLKKCMDVHADYYAPVLRAKKS